MAHRSTITRAQFECIPLERQIAREDESQAEERASLIRIELDCAQPRATKAESRVGELEGEVRYHLAHWRESHAKKVVEDLEAAWKKAETIYRDSRISEPELYFKGAEDRLLEAKEGQSVAESDLSLCKEAEETALGSLQRKSAQVASLEVTLVDTPSAFLLKLEQSWISPSSLSPIFRGLDGFRVQE